MGQILYENHYLSLKKIGNYIYSHESRSNGKLVAILVYDSSRPDVVLGRYEICPAHEDTSPQLCAITGGVEKGRTPIESAITELREEAGYCADESELESLGEVRPSKSADTLTYLYAFNANGKAQHKVTGDGSEYELGAYCKWVRKEQAIWCKDPLMALMIARADNDRIDADLAREYVSTREARAMRGSWEKFQKVLAKVPDVEPEDYDKL